MDIWYFTKDNFNYPSDLFLGIIYNDIGNNICDLNFTDDEIIYIYNIADSYNNPRGLTNIALLYYDNKDYDNFLLFTKKSLIKYKYKDGVPYSRLGNYYENIVHDLNSALKYYKKSVLYGENYAIADIGNIYFKLGKNNISIKYFNLAIKINKDLFAIRMLIAMCIDIKDDPICQKTTDNIPMYIEKYLSYYVNILEYIDILELLIDYYIWKNDYNNVKKYYLDMIKYDVPFDVINKKMVEDELFKYQISLFQNNACSYECTICKSATLKCINLKCYDKYNHTYCIECFSNWYKNNTHKCLLCYYNFNIFDDNLFNIK
jgi:tetratricopeptide (TPR) repeat protein